MWLIFVDVIVCGTTFFGPIVSGDGPWIIGCTYILEGNLFS